MPDPNQITPTSFDRPSARPTTPIMPVQRGNYGIPPRRSPSGPTTPQTSMPQPQPAIPTQTGPLMMDVAPRRPSVMMQQPQVQSTPVAAPQETAPITPAPVASSQTPLFNAVPQHEKAPAKQAQPSKLGKLAPKLKLAVLVFGVLLTLGGLGRLVTAPNIDGYTAGVAAVTANDSKVMTLQFTADDGKLHKFSANSNPEFIPGTAVEVAYRPGAADNTVKQVAVVKATRNLGITLMSLGGFLLIVSGIAAIVTYRRRPKITAPTPVAVAV